MYNINEVLDDICNAKYTYEGYDKKVREGVILASYDTDYAEKKEAIRHALEEHLSKYYEKIFDLETEIGQLKGQVYTYESIVANSNFAPLIVKGEKHV